MKFKIKPFACIVVLAVASIISGCEKSGGEIDPAPPATLELDKTEVTFGPTPGSYQDVEYNSNHPVVTAVVEASAAEWCSVIVSTEKIRIQARTINGDYTPRTAKVTVTAGANSNTLLKTITVTQTGIDPPAATLTLSSSSVSVAKDAGAYVEVTATTNQTVLTASVSADETDWCSATVNNKTIRITAITSNTTDSYRYATVTVTAGEGSAATSKEINFSQAGTGTSTEIISLYDFKNGGIVFWISEDETNYKVLSLTEASGAESRWCTERSPQIGANDSENGVANVQKMKEQSGYAEHYPAANYCDNLAGGGWYLPAINELKAVRNATMTPQHVEIPAMNAAMTANGGTILNITGGTYWSSTENSEANATVVRFSDNLVSHFAKDGSARFVRCVKKINK